MLQFQWFFSIFIIYCFMSKISNLWKHFKMSLFCSFECEAIAEETHRVSYNSLCMFIINSQIFSKIYLINYQWCVVNLFTKNLLKQKDINLFVVVYVPNNILNVLCISVIIRNRHPRVCLWHLKHCSIYSHKLLCKK